MKKHTRTVSRWKRNRTCRVNSYESKTLVSIKALPCTHCLSSTIIFIPVGNAQKTAS